MNKILNEIVVHMEFLGYQIEPRDENTILAKHSVHGNTHVKVYLEGILVQQLFRLTDKAKSKRLEFLEAINKLNSTANVATFVSGSDDDVLRIDGLFLGEYSKQKFGLFLEKYNFDTNQYLLSHEDVRSFLA